MIKWKSKVSSQWSDDHLFLWSDASYSSSQRNKVRVPDLINKNVVIVIKKTMGKRKIVLVKRLEVGGVIRFGNPQIFTPKPHTQR